MYDENLKFSVIENVDITKVEVKQRGVVGGIYFYALRTCSFAWIAASLRHGFEPRLLLIAAFRSTALLSQVSFVYLYNSLYILCGVQVSGVHLLISVKASGSRWLWFKRKLRERDICLPVPFYNNKDWLTKRHLLFLKYGKKTALLQIYFVITSKKSLPFKTQIYKVLHTIFLCIQN